LWQLRRQSRAGETADDLVHLQGVPVVLSCGVRSPDKERRMKHGCTADPSAAPPVVSERLKARFALLVVSDASFLYYARQWRALRKHRQRLREAAREYPLVIDFTDARVVCERPEEVDFLTHDLRTKLVRVWVSGTETGSETRR
jgi:hypothetical protein